MKKILLHIGKHKTGSTSFQLFLRKSRQQLEASGIHPMPHGLGNRLAAFAIRDNLPIPPLLDMKDGAKPSHESVIHDIEAFLAGKDIETLLITCEHFSYFRTKAEIQALRSCLPENIPVFAYLVLRDREGFRTSYRDQITSSGHGPNEDPSSPYYCEPDSWLLDDETLKACWELNADGLTIIDYSRERMLERLGSAMQLPPEVLTKDYVLNKNSPNIKKLKSLVRQTLKGSTIGKSSLRKFRKWKWG